MGQSEVNYFPTEIRYERSFALSCCWEGPVRHRTWSGAGVWPWTSKALTPSCLMYFITETMGYVVSYSPQIFGKKNIPLEIKDFKHTTDKHE